MAYQIQHRSDTATNWTSTNPVLAQGEMGLEQVTNKIKIGNGSTAWTSLPYVGSGLTNWIDVTLQGVNAVLPGNSAAANVTALNAILAAATAGDTLYFPVGTYQFNANITVSIAVTFQGQMGVGGSVPGTYLETTSTTAGLFTVTTNWGAQFSNLGFTCNATQTSAAAAMITNSGMDYVNIVNCTFGGGAGTPLYNCISYTGGTANIFVISGCTFAGFAGTAILLATGGSGIIQNCTANGNYTGTSYAVAGINISQSGGLFLSNIQVVSCTTNCLINPTVGNGVTSVQAVNCYFDQANGSALQISGAGFVQRCLFSSCWFTTLPAASSPSCISINSTYAYTTIGQGIIFNGCYILNTQSTATATGVNLNTGYGDVEITDCLISNWTTGISSTANATSGVSRPLITGCVIGPSGGYAGNATGIALGSATTYGTISITGNNLGGNTSNPLTDSSSVVSGSQKLIVNNTGLPITGNSVTPSATGTALTTGLVTYGTLAIPLGSFRAGQVYRCRAQGVQTTAAAVTYTAQVTLGTVPTSLFATAPTMLTGAVVGHFDIEVLVYIVSSASNTTVEALGIAKMTYLGVATAAGNSVAPAATAATIADASATTLNLQLEVSAADATLWGPVVMEVLQQ